MKRNVIGKIAGILAATVLLTTAFTADVKAGDASSANEELIRVGLYYKGGSVNTAQSVFDVSAQSGIMAGFVKEDGKFVEIYRFNSPSTVYVRRMLITIPAGQVSGNSAGNLQRLPERNSVLTM